jgi:hypothetical protein
MRKCTYCGKEYAAGTSLCAVDGQPLQDVVSPPPTGMRVPKSFFRWKPVSISLIVLAILYWAVALLNLWLVGAHQGDTRNLRFLLWGSFWNLVVGSLCLGGRGLMKSGSRIGCAAGALAVSAALLVVMRNWLGGLLTGRSPFPSFEALLVWPWLIYAIVYATVIQKQVGAEPAAPPNRGPATQTGNSKVTEGPPSVS